MEELESSSNIHSELGQSLQNARERFDTLFRAAPTDQNTLFPGLQELNQSVEASMQRLGTILNFLCLSWFESAVQSLGSRPLRAPAASKEVVANLPTITLTEETLMKLGIDTECAVCNENLVIDDKTRNCPASTCFTLSDKRNSCLVCRHELPTDNEAYESWKKSEKEAEKARRDAANSVC
ncbi:hypothetical protein MKW92_014506 [Papaver armeniacum]|nr:hypothetical protein MKW92_014506 [Papaver armeniacum]